MENVLRYLMPSLFYNAFEESSISLNTEVLFAGNMPLEEEEEDDVPVSAEDLIAQAKQRMHTTGGKSKRPSSKSTSIVGCGEGRATQEVEIIWWPDLYEFTFHGRLVIRFFIKNVYFKVDPRSPKIYTTHITFLMLLLQGFP